MASLCRLHQSQQCCPKDSFPLPRIDQIVDSTSGQGMLSFLDAFSGYHQIPMSPDDEEKTAFITPHGLYCYKVMPFGLKNAGATYQRLMTKIFKPLIGHSVEVYIDDIVVKSKTREQHILHLQEVFHLLRRIYGQPKGIEVSPDQVKAVMETPPPRNKKEIQRLTGKLVALGRFIARFTMSCDPSSWQYEKLDAWVDGQLPKRFGKIKHCLMQPPILSSPIPKRNYTCIWQCQNGQSGRSIPLPSPKEQNPSTMSAGHWQTILHKPDLTGRMLQWAIELSEFGIEFQPRYPKRPSSGVGLLLQSPTGEHLEQAIRLGFSASNNEAEYEAILSGLDLALALSVSKLRIYSDSQLVVRHVQKEYEAKDARMARYLAKVRSTLQQFTEWTIEKIKRADNGALTPWPNISGQALYPKILNKRTKSGCKLPVSP
ncbi:Transposon Ty3-G Gag-Pol polyprotein [Vitis vinifera]|uniref:Transposon Ty3-G Gag-Pol polyprotein n=1 Tax=Vitis vinifera TaxID=29760 RepID=A0A438JM63_VITVI|nr:Transposon Ty3-G Gag-Pol polyprotein [Vitis vinifera]